MPTIWPAWCAGTTTTVTINGNGYARDSDNPWQSWTTSATVSYTTTTSYTTTVWDTWNANAGMSRAPRVAPSRVQYQPLPEPTARELLVRRNRDRARWLRERVAERRALALLRENLTDEQRAELDSTRAFHVETAEGTRRYRIRVGYQGNVELVRNADREAPPGGRLARYCAHIADYGIPRADHMLAQKLLLEADEPAFLAMANVS